MLRGKVIVRTAYIKNVLEISHTSSLTTQLKGLEQKRIKHTQDDNY